MNKILILGMVFVGFLTSCADLGGDDSASSANDDLIDTRDGKHYKTVVIGKQTWMAENLNYGTMVLSAKGQINDSVAEKFCYGDTASYCTTDGGLYNWAEAMALPSKCDSTTCVAQISSGNHQGICPTGWHIPKAEEWDYLENYLGGSPVAGTKMKLNATGFSKWDATKNNDGNSSGFSAFPAGFYHNSDFIVRGEYAYFWDAEESNPVFAYYRAWYHGVAYLGVNNYKKFGFSVRCVKDGVEFK